MHRGARLVVGMLSVATLACSSEAGAPEPASTFGRGASGPGGSGAGASGQDPGGLGAPGEGGGGGTGPASSCAARTLATTRSPVDVIFVVDSSSSMAQERQQVRDNINAMAAAIAQKGVDARIIMIGERGTDATQMCVPPPLGGPSCGSNPPAYFHSEVRVSSKEHLYRLVRAYDDPDPARAWGAHVRFDSVKAIVVVSDDNSYMEWGDFEQQLFAKAPAGVFGDASHRKYVLHSIVGWREGTPPLDGAPCATAMNNGHDFQQLSVLTGGVIESVCKTDYSAVLAKIGRSIVQHVSCEFSLPEDATGYADYGKVYVAYTPAGAGAPTALPRVSGAAGCAARPDGWHFDDPHLPRRVRLCDGICRTVQGDDDAKVDVVVGCAIVRPR